jgi:hypothetical protein
MKRHGEACACLCRKTVFSRFLLTCANDTNGGFGLGGCTVLQEIGVPDTSGWRDGDLPLLSMMGPWLNRLLPAAKFYFEP